MIEILTIGLNILLDTKPFYSIKIQVDKKQQLTLSDIISHILSIVTNRSQNQKLTNGNIFINATCQQHIDIKTKPDKNMILYYNINQQQFQQWNKFEKKQKVPIKNKRLPQDILNVQALKSKQQKKGIKKTQQSKITGQQSENGYNNKKEDEKEKYTLNQKIRRQEVNLQTSNHISPANIDKNQSRQVSENKIDSDDNNIDENNQQSKELLKLKKTTNNHNLNNNQLNQNKQNKNEDLNNVKKVEVASKDDCCKLI